MILTFCRCCLIIFILYTVLVRSLDYSLSIKVHFISNKKDAWIIKILIYWITVLVISLLLIYILQGIKNSIYVRKEKWDQFECGFTSMNPSHLPFSFQFFFVALLFLIFDVEIALLISYPTEPQSAKNLLVIFIFLLILTIGLVYEWQKRKIDWSNWIG